MAWKAAAFKAMITASTSIVTARAGNASEFQSSFDSIP
jgi:hypothetical protein